MILPEITPCEECGYGRDLRLCVNTGYEGHEPDHEVRMYRCRCIQPPVQILERRNGGEWGWRPFRSEHRS